MSIIATEPSIRETFHIATLNYRNYQPWSVLMLAAFADSNCESIVLGGGPQPSPAATTATATDAAATNAAIASWNKRNRSALYRIYRAISQQELITLAGITLASEAWEKLKKVHRVEGAAGKMLLLRKLTRLQMDDVSSPQEYVNRFEHIVAGAALLNLGLKQLPELLSVVFLNGLPPSLEAFVKFTTLSASSTISPANITNMLTPKTVTASFLEHVKTTKYGKDSSSFDDDLAMRFDKATAICHNCRRKGHSKAECRSLVRDINQPTDEGRSRQQDRGDRGRGSRPHRGRGRGRNSANIAEQQAVSRGQEWGYIFQQSTSENTIEVADYTEEDGWIIDSGCSNHICNDRSRFKTYEPYSTQFKVADSQFVGTVGRGSITINTLINNIPQSIPPDLVIAPKLWPQRRSSSTDSLHPPTMVRHRTSSFIIENLLSTSSEPLDPKLGPMTGPARSTRPRPSPVSISVTETTSTRRRPIDSRGSTRGEPSSHETSSSTSPQCNNISKPK